MIGTQVQIRRPHKRHGCEGVVVEERMVYAGKSSHNGTRWYRVRTLTGGYWLAREQFTVIEAARAA